MRIIGVITALGGFCALAASCVTMMLSEVYNESHWLGIALILIGWTLRNARRS